MNVVVVGCPVRYRDWILPTWFTQIDDACRYAEVAPHFVFVGDPKTDPKTFAAIDEWCLANSRDRDVVEVDEPADDKNVYRRVWNRTRFSEMVALRNLLLNRVRAIGPDLFWSVDSDILVAPAALASASELLDQFDAVGSRAYMTQTGRVCPSYGMLSPLGGLVRPDSAGCFEVDVIMAIKLMTPAAFDVDYQLHRQGEDIGWSVAARKAGVRLGWDGRTCSKHVMEPLELHRVDDRAGF